MVDQVRIRCQNQFQNNGDLQNYRKIKNLSRLLKTCEYRQAAYCGTHLRENQQRLQDAFVIAPDLMEAYDALQFFHDILGSFPFSVQSEELTEWIKTYASSDVEEVRSAACTIRHWRGYIQNSWKYKKSNGLSEGLNNRNQVCLLYPFLGTIHLKILISSVFTRVCGSFTLGYRGEPHLPVLHSQKLLAFAGLDPSV